MAHSYPVWVDINSCAYESQNKSYGIKKDGIQNIKIGTSAKNSHHFATINIKVKDIDGGKIFKLYVDNVKIKEATVLDKDCQVTLDRLKELGELVSK